MSRHEATDRRRRGPAWRRTLLVVGAILGTACIVMGIVAVAFDARALIFRSGSMAPAIDTGALAFARSVDATDLNVGDIVSVENQEGVRVTHRIVEIEHDDDQATMSLKGDDNSVVDAQTYRVSSADRVLFAVPKAGYVVSFLTGPVGLFALGLYAAFLLWVLFGGGARGSTDEGGAHRGSRGTAVVVAVALATSWGATSGAPQSTHAAWSDSAAAISGAFQTHYLQAPTSMQCQNGSRLLPLTPYYNSVTFQWSHRDVNYDYVVYVYNQSGTLVGTREVAGAGVPGSTQSTTFAGTEVAGLLPLGQPVDFHLHSKLKTAPTWESEADRSWRVNTGILDLGLGLGLADGIACGSDTSGPGDNTGPTIAFSAPTNGVNTDAGDYRAVIRDICGRNRPGCGTVSDPSGVASVSYQLMRVRSNGTEYFHASSAIGGIWNSDAEFETTAIGSGKWEIDGLVSTAYFDWNEDMQFTLTIQATDNVGNTSTASINFVLQ